MKKFFRILAIIVVVFMGLLIALPFLFKDKLVEATKSYLSTQVKATIDFRSVSVGLIRSFPDLQFSLHGFTVINQAPFAGDTLIHLDRLSLRFDLMKVIGGTYEIKGFFLSDGLVQIKTNKEGISNYDILPASESEAKDTSGSGNEVFNLQLKRYGIKNLRVEYADDSTGDYISIQSFSHSGTGDFSSERFLVKTITEIKQLSIESGQIKYLNKAELFWKADVEVATEEAKVTFQDNIFQLNDLELRWDGFVAVSDSIINLDLRLATTKTSLKSLLSLIPGAYTADFKDVKTTGDFSFNAFVQGDYVDDQQVPAFGMQLLIDQGSFQYPNLPAKVDQIFIDLGIRNPGGKLDFTIVDLKRADMLLGGDPLGAKVLIKQPISNPAFDINISTALDLSKIKNYYPAPELSNLSGLLEANATLSGRLSDIEREMYQNVKASGKVKIQQLKYSSSDVQLPIEVDLLDLELSPERVMLKELSGKAGRSDFKLAGGLDQFYGYLFSDAPLRGRLNLFSNLLDLNEWITEDSGGSGNESAGDTSGGVLRIPAGIAFHLSTQINRLLFETYEIQQLRGQLEIANQTMVLSDLSGSIFEGSFQMRGRYGTSEKFPTFNYQMDIRDLDIQKCFLGSPIFQSIAPVARHINGRFSSGLTISGSLNEGMDPVYSSLNGEARVEIKNGILKGSETLQQIAGRFQLNQLKEIELKDLRVLLTFVNGRVTVTPFDFRTGSMLFQVSGSHGFDQSLDYQVFTDVPTTLLGPAAGVVNDLLTKNPVPGLIPNQLPTQVQLRTRIEGTVDQPKLTFSVGKGGERAAAQQQIKDYIDQQRKALEDKAREEAERLKKEAEDRARAEVEKRRQQGEDAARQAREEADKARREAEERAKKEADKAKEQVKDRIKFPR